MNGLSIVKVALILTVMQVAVSTLLYFAVDEPKWLMICQYVATTMVALAVLTIYAKAQTVMTLIHVGLAQALSWLIAGVATSVLFGQLFIPSMWFVDLMLGVSAVCVSVFVGTYIRGVSSNAT